MKVVFHERFREVYDNDPAAAKGRLDEIAVNWPGIMTLLSRHPPPQRISSCVTLRPFCSVSAKGSSFMKWPCWGFCWFNNVAIAVEKMRWEAGVGRVLVVDID